MSMTFYVAEEQDGPEVNMSNGNAWAVLEFIGVEPDYGGEIDAEELVALCAQKLIRDTAAPPAPGVPVTETQIPGGARIINWGRPEGYREARTLDLFKLATHAGKRKVRWS